MRVTGILPPIITPFDDSGEIDWTALDANLERWNETGLAGYVVAGSNGESASLTCDEVAALTERVRLRALPQQQVIAGTGRQSTRETIALTRAAAAAGADLVLVMTPSFFAEQMGGPALVEHYQRVADASPVPVLLYNVPKYTHVNMAPATVAALAQHPNIVGLKDSSGNITQMIGLLSVCPRDFSLLVGNGGAFLSAVALGACGAVLALANVAPRECVRVYELIDSGEAAAAQELAFRLVPVNTAVTVTYGVPGLKAALTQLGYRGGVPRLPLQILGAQEQRDLEAILRKAQLIQ
ncbi:MAG: dihydrodipicolinate synthase family protein [Chloroflexi bacterium]|nr:dihydrodipicolinate synthase family protein [Chloroflexota bacterium]